MNIRIPKEKPKNSKEMPSNAWGQLRSYLARQGYSQAWIEEAIGGNPGGRSKLEIIGLLQEALRNDNV